MNRERLLRLADLVETIAPEKFDLRTWGGYRELRKQGDYLECGTVSCAVGWAAEDAWFQSQGLSDRWNPTYAGCSGWEAVSKFFDLPPSADAFQYPEAHFLFCEDSYVTRPVHPSEVAIRIRLFVEHHDEKVVRELELA